jgi:two-component system phosphate regulon sensor histidine kinase PhoR
VRLQVVDGPTAGERTVFLADVSELRRLETVRQEFVANLSHELKTPVTSLRLAAESLQSDPPPDLRRRFAERILAEADHLASMVDNLRQLAEIEGERVRLELEWFELEPLVREAGLRLELGSRLRVDVPAGLRVRADRPKLAQAVGNLIDNAAKFSPPGSPVEVGVLAMPGELVLKVSDSGPGISPEHWDRIFERFYKVDPSRTRGVPGSGLGLAIAKHLVQAHGGRIWTEARPEGGQVFALAIPSGEP